MAKQRKQPSEKGGSERPGATPSPADQGRRGEWGGMEDEDLDPEEDDLDFDDEDANA